ncbi:hypothetical protein Tco_1319515 [Tanacetum coccineum]
MFKWFLSVLKDMCDSFPSADLRLSPDSPRHTCKRRIQVGLLACKGIHKEPTISTESSLSTGNPHEVHIQFTSIHHRGIDSIGNEYSEWPLSATGANDSSKSIPPPDDSLCK